MKIDAAIMAAATLAIAVASLWAAWRLAEGEMFFACCGVFAAGFWGALCGCVVWSGICRWRVRDDLPEASVIMPQLRQTGRRP